LLPSALLREHDIACGLTVPIRLRSRMFGVLGAHATRKREFTSADTHFLQAIANVVATAIERRLAEEALRESNERFRLLVEEVKGFAIITLDPEACVLTWNQGAEHLFGYSASEMIGRPVSRLYPCEDVQLGKPELDLRLAEEMGQFEDEDWRQQAGGTQFWANVVITALRRADGTLRGYGIVTRDMTERRQAHEALRLNEEKIRSLVNHIPDAVWTMNAAGDALFLSGNAERIYGCPAAELKAPGAALGLGRVHADDAPRLRAAWLLLREKAMVGRVAAVAGLAAFALGPARELDLIVEEVAGAPREHVGPVEANDGRRLRPGGGDRPGRVRGVDVLPAPAVVGLPGGDRAEDEDRGPAAGRGATASPRLRKRARGLC